MRVHTLTGVLAAVAVLAFALPASAQLQRGALYGTVVDNTGAVLPGVSVTLASPVMAPLTVVSGSHGEYRFGQLDPGTYTLTASLQGFAPFTRKDIVITVGSNVQIPVQLALAGVRQEVTVTAATPVLNEKTHGNETTFGDAAINEIPTARDPWVLLQQVPGVLVDRVNVGGSESGQQSTFVARGDNGYNTMWNIDGVTITDMAGIGSSPAYYDFDVFQDVQFTTSATDPREQTGALGINMVTKRGTNAFHGLGSYFFDNHSLQTTNLPSGLSGTTLTGNKINQIADYSGDIGGPVVKDKLWFWGALARNDIRLQTIQGFPDDTLLDSGTVKIDAQPVANNHADFFWYRNQKIKNGRNSSPERPPETTWNQGGPTDIYKFEDSHTFGSKLLATARYAHLSSSFFLTPQGGLNTNVFLDQNDVWHGSFLGFSSTRPQDEVNGDASYFSGVHELKFGFSYRRTPVSSSSQWPFDHFVVSGGLVGLPAGQSLVTLTRANAADTSQRDVGFYAGDTVSLSRVTIDAALRYDRQNGYNTASSVPANSIAPNVLPALSLPQQSPLFDWNAWSPRIGATYRIDDKTNVRASYALFEGQLPSAYIVANNPVILSGVTYAFADDGSHIPAASNIDFSNIISSYGVNPANPASLASPNTIDPNLKPPRTQSLIVGLDREVLPNFAISTSFGYGYNSNVIWEEYPGLTTADFVQTGTVGTVASPTGQAITSTTPIYQLAPGVTLPSGVLLSNRAGYHQRYWNWDVTATKRLSNRWMLRGYFTLQNMQEYFDNPSQAIQDPQPLAATGANTASAGYASDPEFTAAVTFVNPLVNGGIAPVWAGGTSLTSTDIFLQSKWSYSLMGLYQFPYGITASGTVYGRQGYPNPSFVTVNRGPLGSNAPVLVNTDLNANRSPNVNLVDVRAEKSFTMRGVSAIVSLDAFNAFNNNSVLQSDRLVTSSTFGLPRAIVAPRIFRLGLRVQF